MRVTKRQLRRMIREVIEGPDGVWYDDYGNPLQPDDPKQGGGKGWQLADGRCNSHNISPGEVAEAMAVLEEFGYSLFIPPAVDDNQVSINDALAAYPGEYTYEDFMCAIQIAQGRGA